MPAIMCSCGYSRESVTIRPTPSQMAAGGVFMPHEYFRCTHCDIPCDNPDTCARCRTYALVTGKRISA